MSRENILPKVQDMSLMVDLPEHLRHIGDAVPPAPLKNAVDLDTTIDVPLMSRRVEYALDLDMTIDRLGCVDSPLPEAGYSMCSGDTVRGIQVSADEAAKLREAGLSLATRTDSNAIGSTYLLINRGACDIPLQR